MQKRYHCHNEPLVCCKSDRKNSEHGKNEREYEYRMTRKVESENMKSYDGKNIELVMSYDQWKEKLERDIRHWMKRKTMEFFSFALLPGLSLLMVAHWIIVGY